MRPIMIRLTAASAKSEASPHQVAAQMTATAGRKTRPAHRMKGRSPTQSVSAVCVAPRAATPAPLQAPIRAYWAL